MGNALSNLRPATHRLPSSRRSGRRVGTAEVHRINSAAAGLAPGRRLNCVATGNGCPPRNPPSSRRSRLSFGKENDELIHLIKPRLCRKLGEPHNGFQGLRLEASTNWWHAFCRDLISWLQTWNGFDPTGYPDGMNGYQAYRSAPVGLMDSAGLQAQGTLPTEGGWTDFFGSSKDLDTISKKGSMATDLFASGIDGLNRFYGNIGVVIPKDGAGGARIFTGAGQNAKLHAEVVPFWQWVKVCKEDGPFTVTYTELGRVTWGSVVPLQRIDLKDRTPGQWAQDDASHPHGEFNLIIMIFDAPTSAQRIFATNIVSPIVDFDRTVKVSGKGGRSTSHTVHVHFRIDNSGKPDNINPVQQK